MRTLSDLDKGETQYCIVCREGFSGPWTIADAMFDTDKDKVYAKLLAYRAVDKKLCFAIAKRKCPQWSICIRTIPTKGEKMKTLEQLDISPSPWKIDDDLKSWPPCGHKISCKRWMLAQCYSSNNGDARLIASAPTLYDMLYKLVEACRAVGYKEFDPESSQAEHKLYALLDEAEVALNEAAEEPIKL